MGGFGGALKQLSIGFASTQGKTWIHTAGESLEHKDAFAKNTSQIDFTASMADAASGIVNYFKSRGGIVYLNVLANISIDCDCAGTSAHTPEITDIGILASTDPVAIDQACYDLIKNTSETGTETFLKRVREKEGLNTIESAVNLGIGNKEYNLIEVNINNDDDTDPGNKESSSFVNLPWSLILLLLVFFV